MKKHMAKTMQSVLIKNKKYIGKYVALKDFKDKTVVSYGADPQKVYEKAQKKGVANPVIVYIPVQDMVQIY